MPARSPPTSPRSASPASARRRSTTSGSSTATRTSATSSRSAPRTRYLLGLCFCEHCLAAARAAGVDGEAVRRSAREAIERAFAGDDPGGEPERDEYARVRAQVVTSLVAEVAEAAGETPFEFIELSGAVQGLRRRPADRRPGALDRVAARRRRRRRRRRLRRDRGDRLRGRPGAHPRRPRGLRRRRSLRHLPPVDPRLRLGRGPAREGRPRPRARPTPRRLLPLRAHAAGRAGLDTRRPDALSARPGSASVRRPSSTTTTPFTSTYGIPSGSRRGSS